MNSIFINSPPSFCYICGELAFSWLKNFRKKMLTQFFSANEISRNPTPMRNYYDLVGVRNLSKAQTETLDQDSKNENCYCHTGTGIF